MRNDLSLYTLKERIFFVKTFYKNDNDVKCVKNNYSLEYGALDDAPTDSLIFEVINLFEETGSVRELPKIFPQIQKEEPDVFIGDTILSYDKPETMMIKIDPDLLQTKECNKNPSTSLTRSAQKRSLKNTKRITKDKPVESTSVPTSKTEPMNKEETEFICDICKKKCRSKRGMQAHMVQHMRREEISCKHCLKSFPTNYQLKRHIREIHEKEIKKEKPTIECSFCSKTFTQPNLLRQHMLRHSDKKEVICEVCGKAFKRKHTLNHHMKVHTGEKPYKCDYPNCDRAFRDRNSYTIHKRCHTDERPFPCHYCGKCFRDKGTLRIHYRQHTGENPYKCELCGKETKQKQNLQSHMRHFHRINSK